ncbi:MAG TPA: P-loop NTPase [Acidimicrobiia bacterium]|nr:P-loop NTPase [Acidimicrobiia bacterium]
MTPARRYRVVAVEPDARFRTRLSIQLAGITSETLDTLEALSSLVASGEPTVALFGPGLANDTGFAHAQRMSRQHPELGVVLLAEELTLPLLQQALRSGVRDALALDTDDAQIRATVERVGDAIATLALRTVPVGSAGKYGKVIVAFSTKGGVGKSVVATNVAVSLATRGHDTVIVDADLQFGDVAVLLGVPPVHTTVEAADAIDAADNELMDGLLAKHEASGLRVLAAPVEPVAGDSITAEQMVAIVNQLRTMFEYVVVDMPPHFDDVVLSLLEEADDVLLVASMDIPSIKNLKVGIQTLDLLTVAGSKLRLVLNRANAKVNLDVADVERALGVPAEFRIPSDISVPQAVNRGVPVVLDRPRSAAALSLAGLAESFVERAAAAADDADAGRRPLR